MDGRPSAQQRASQSPLSPLRYGPAERFGARQAHVLEADCSNRRWRTVATFVSTL